ncbi:glycoside hydrolase domain-containing protein [Frateuria sp. Soil773]|uniref:glycoside hydrolase domain-containing protein n=1 Tax=Frateuria sp. Soil773 TaxID=1736407 RepID=UPI000A601495|nr:glycoside hydrolase domain-containing protein [Frateuria sp. Soil773]
MSKRRRSCLLAGMLLGASAALWAQPQTFASGTQLRWDASAYGNHRYLVQVARPAEAVHVVIPWRRRDAHPERVAAIVVGPDGKPVANVLRGAIDQASGELVFEARQAGVYAVYYQPYISNGRSNYPTVTYAAPKDTAAADWAGRQGHDAARWRKLPSATVLRYEGVTDFDAYTAMERIATPAEVRQLLAAHTAQALWLFPETRANPVRMFDQLPQRWAQRGPGGELADKALRGEYLSFQIGVWAPRAALDRVQVAFADLRGPGGAVLPASALTCFNLGGTDFTGRPFTARVDVPQGRVQPLWMGLDVPADAKPGMYRGEVTISADGQPPQTVPLAITVAAEAAVAHGDDDPSRLTRLRWLNSTLAQDDALVKPFTAITVRGARLGILGRDVALANSGLPAQIESRFDERMTGFAKQPRALLAAPMQLLVQDASGSHALQASAPPPVQADGPAKVHWQASGEAGPLQGEVTASLEADGTLNYAIALKASRAVALKDIRLEIPLRNDAAQYELGLGRTGGRAPADFNWTWDVQRNQDGAWIGAVNAGLEFHLRDEHYLRPLNTNFYHQQPLRMPASWDNGGQGGITFKRDGARYLVKAFSGPRTMAAGQVLRYDLVLRVTPFKTIKPAEHFAERFFHKYADLDAIKADGANVVNIHHATPINPWINYPFLEAGAMRGYVEAAHQRGMKVKIYDTIREVSDRAPELPMLESLGHEVISAGKGGGFSWLQEHLDGDYIAAWHVPENRDAAVINAGQSRWHNYYIEGLDWLARNVGIDGLYLDDVAYDRTTMKRVRKVFAARRPHPLIDLHSANQYNPRDGYINSALLYMELFPYIDRLWFGEEFDYEKTSPSYWLTEMSGIPYGLMGEMLQHDGNPWRGMLFGMTSRLGWSEGSDPRPLWKLWDSFGIEQAQMIGWWVHDTPVKTGRDDVLATSYVRDGKTLVALASWAPQRTTVKLRIDWKALGLKPGSARLVAPAVERFQPAASFKPGDAIPLEPGKGWLLVLEPAG